VPIVPFNCFVTKNRNYDLPLSFPSAIITCKIRNVLFEIPKINSSSNHTCIIYFVAFSYFYIGRKNRKTRRLSNAFPKIALSVDGNGVYKSIGATLRNCRLEKFSTTKPRVSFVCAYVYAYRSHPAAGLSRILRLVISHKSENPRIDFRSSDLSGTLHCRIFFEPSTIKFHGSFSISSPFCKKKRLSIFMQIVIDF